MTRRVQDDIRPGLIPMTNRGTVLKALGSTAAQLRRGSAVAIMGPPGADLHRLANDIIRGIDDQTVIVWVDFARLSHVVRRLDDGADPSREGGAWDQAIRTTLASSFARALSPDGEQGDTAGEGLSGSLDELLLHFATLTQGARYWPVIVLESMHEIPWVVSERLQRVLRAALDNNGRQQVLRLVMTGHSDFLSGEAIPEGTGYHTSPLYVRTDRYVVAPFSEKDLWELSPLPGGLPDDLIGVLVRVTGGYVGFLELFMEAIHADATLGIALLETFREDTTPPPKWLWEWLARAEGLAQPGRDLIRQGLSTMLSNAKGRSRHILEALERLVEGLEVEEISAETLLPLELAGLVGLTPDNGRFIYRFATPLVKPLLMATLPRAEDLRHRLEAFATQTPARDEVRRTDTPRPGRPRTRTEVKTTGTRRHVTTTLESEPLAPAQVVNRSPLYLPPPVDTLVADRGPSSARALIELLKAITRAVQQARNTGNQEVLTLSQLEIRWVSLGEGDAAPALSPLGAQTITAELATEELRGRWDVRLSSERPTEAQREAAAAFFVAPERLPRYLEHRGDERPFVPTYSDDAYAIGVLAGLLLTRKTSPQQMLERLEERLSGATDISVGPLVRLVRRCLDGTPDERPTLDELNKGLHQVLNDPLARWRRTLRYLLVVSLAALFGTALYDYFLDTQVDNPSRFYTMLKVVGAGGGAAFYLLAWLVIGRTDKAQVNQALWVFLKQRMNRFHWLLVPTIIALVLTGVFGYRIWQSQGVQISLPEQALLEEIRARVDEGESCELVHHYPSPVPHASVRLRLDGNRAYSFVVLVRDESDTPRRVEYYWPPEQVAAQRRRQWGDTLDLYRLPRHPPDGHGCLSTRENQLVPPANPGQPMAPHKGLEHIPPHSLTAPGAPGPTATPDARPPGDPGIRAPVAPHG